MTNLPDVARRTPVGTRRSSPPRLPLSEYHVSTVARDGRPEPTREVAVRFGTFHLIGAPTMQPGEQRVRETIEQMVLAEEIGLDKVWVAEHHFADGAHTW